MTLIWLRDLAIVILVVLAIGATVLFTVVGIMLYRKVGSVLDSAKIILGDVRSTVSLVSDTVVKPTVKAFGFMQGIRQAIAAIAKLSGKKGGEKHG